MDWNRFSTEELEAISNKDWDKVSTANLEYYVNNHKKESTSIGDDLKIGLANATGTINRALGEGLGGAIAVPEQLLTGDVKTATALSDWGAKSKERLTKWGSPEDKEQSFGGKAIGMIGTLPVQIAAMPFSPVETSLEAQRLGESIDTATGMGMVDAAGVIAGLKLPAMAGKGLLQKGLSGFGINAAQDYATRQTEANLAQGEAAKKAFAPTLETTALAGLPGLGIGAAHHLMVGDSIEPSLTKPPVSEEQPTPIVGEKELVQSRIDEAQRQKEYAEYQISKLEKEYADPKNAKRTPEEAEAFANEIAAKIEEHQKDIASSERAIRNGQDIIAGKEVTKTTGNESNEFPSSNPPRPEEQPYINTKQQESIPEEQTVNKNMFDTSKEEPDSNKIISDKIDFITSQIERSNDSIARLTKQAEEAEEAEKSASIANELISNNDNWKEGDEPPEYLKASDINPNVKESSHSIRAAIKQHKNIIESHQKYIKELLDEQKNNSIVNQYDNGKATLDNLRKRLAVVESNMWDIKDNYRDEKYKGEFNELVKERAALEDRLDTTHGPKAEGPIIKGLSKEEEDAVRGILEELGLDKERIDIDLEHVFPEDEPRFGEAYAKDDTAIVNVTTTEQFREFINSSQKAREFAATLSKDASVRFAKMFTVAHEIGHVLLDKLVQTGLYGKELDSLVSEYTKWKDSSSPELVEAYAAVHRRGFGSKERLDYYSQFPEFFAQRVAKVILMGERTPTKLSKFVGDIKKIWNKLTEVFNIGIQSKFFFDDFILKLIDDNKKSLEETGKNLFEIQSTKMSLEDAFIEHNRIFNYKGASEFRPERAGMLADNSFGQRRLSAIGTIEDVKEAVEKQLENGNDINPLGTGTIWKQLGSVLNTGVNNLFGIQQLKGLYSKNPAITYAIDTVIKALNKQSERQMSLLSGESDFNTWIGTKKPFFMSLKKMKEENSPTIVFEKSTEEDFHAVHKVFEQGVGTHSYEESLAKFGATLTEQQKKLFKTLSTMYGKMYKQAAELESTLGKKSIIPNMKGWFPSVRKGEFSVSIHRRGLELIAEKLPDGTRVYTDAVYSQSFRTRREAEEFVAHFKNQPDSVKGGLHLSNIMENGNTELPSTIADFARLYHETVENANRQGIEVDQAVQNLMDSYIARGGTLGKHHKLRTNLPGSKGSELFKNTKELGRAFKEAQFDSIHEYTSLMKKMEIGTKLDLMIEDQRLKDNQPNVHQTIQSIRDYALNKVETPFELKGVRRFFDNIWIDSFKGDSKVRKALGMKKYQNAYISDVAIGKLNHFFYLHVLMGRPAFWAGQASQFMWAARSLVRNGESPIDAMSSFAKGTKQLVSPDEDFLKGVFWASQNTHVFSPQFIHDLSKFHIADFLHEDSKARLLMELSLGEKQSTMADTFSRLMTFATIHEYFKGKGLSGEDLWRKTIELTDENMVQYGRDYKSPVFQKLGPIGDLVSPLATFATASTGNLIADVLHVINTPAGKGKLKATMPLLMTGAITTLMAGAIGAPLIAEYELMRLFLNKVAEALGLEAKLPSVVDMVISGDNTFSNRVLSHGLLSTSTMAIDKEGFDIGSSNRWQPIFQGIMDGNKSFIEFLPTINFALQEAGFVYTIVGNAIGYKDVPEAELRQAKLGITPGMYKGLVDDVVFNAGSRKFEPTAKGDAFLPQTDAKRVAKYLGTSTIEASTERLRNRRFVEMKLQDQQKMNKLKEILVDSIQRKDTEKIKEVATTLATKYGMAPKEIDNFVEAEMFRRNVPQGTRRFVGKNATSNNQQENAYKKWMDLYGDSPFENEN